MNFTHRENCFFFIFFNPLINFQEINIYSKNFSFLQLNIMLVQNTGECTFSLAAEKTFNQFLEFYPQGKITFSIFSFEPISIFQFSWKKKICKQALSLSFSAQNGQNRFGPLQHAHSPALTPAPRQQPGPGPGKRPGARARLG